MRFRLAIVSLLAAGFALSGAGAGLAVSGLVGDDTPSSAQYREQAPSGNVLGDSKSGGPKSVNEQGAPGEFSPQREQGVQAPRQLSQESPSSLPFTGWATIPVILVGLGLLASGLVLRRRTRMQA